MKLEVALKISKQIHASFILIHYDLLSHVPPIRDMIILHVGQQYCIHHSIAHLSYWPTIYHLFSLFFCQLFNIFFLTKNEKTQMHSCLVHRFEANHTLTVLMLSLGNQCVVSIRNLLFTALSVSRFHKLQKSSACNICNWLRMRCSRACRLKREMQPQIFWVNLKGGDDKMLKD